jgi:hypothetical protein
MQPEITRFVQDLSAVSVNTTAGSSTAVDFRSFAGGMIYVPSGGSAIGNITFQVAEKHDGTFLSLEDKAGTAVSITAEINKGYPLPDELFGCAAFRMIAASNTKSCFVTLKG